MPNEEKNASDSFSATNPPFCRSEAHLHQTEHPNGLPASCRLSLVNPETPATSFIRGEPEGAEVEVRLPNVMSETVSVAPVAEAIFSSRDAP